MYFFMNYSQWAVWKSYDSRLVITLTINLQLVKNTCISPCRSPDIMKSKCHENPFNPATTKCKLHIWDSLIYTFHTPSPFPFTRVYTGRGLDGCTLTSCLTKISGIQTGFCRETRGWISTLRLCWGCFIFSILTWLPLERLLCQWIINSTCIWNEH